MKVVRYRRDDREALGLLDAEEEVVHEAFVDPGETLDALSSLIRSGDTHRLRSAGGDSFSLESIELLAPLPRPARNVFAVGKNYWDHSQEFASSGFDRSSHTGDDIPPHPIFFTKPARCIIGPGVAIDPHSDTTSALDYEGELAVIIGRGGRNIRPGAVWDHIWGYTLINDITARDLQRDHKQWFFGKSLDTFCPMGPWAVTADEINVDDVLLQCWVNGELRQKASVRDLIFNIPTLVATLSSGMTLLAGDLIATGTPAGVGIGFTPPRFLQPGDTVTVTATGLGSLSNFVGGSAVSEVSSVNSRDRTSST